MHIERCDIDGCTNERPAPGRKEAYPIKTLDVGSDPGWRYVVEVVMAHGAFPPEMASMLADAPPMLSGMLTQAVGQMNLTPKEVTRLVCPRHDGEKWPLPWKHSADSAATEKAHDGVPRDANGDVIQVD